MAWYPGTQKIIYNKDFTEEVLKIQGEFDETQAKIWLAKFLINNIGFTYSYLSGQELLPLQELIIRSIFKRDNGIIVAARGAGKSFLISVLSILYPLLFFNSKMCLISGNFRASRRILEESEKVITSKRAKLLRSCFGKTVVNKMPDMFRITVPDPSNSEVMALPLTDGLRGTRASLVCVDEGLLITKEIQEQIIRPFLTARLNMLEEQKIKKIENELIETGLMKESERISFPKNKYFVFSSASYQFQYLYEAFQETIREIHKPLNEREKDTSPSSSFAIRFSYEALPEDSHIDLTQIKIAAANGGYELDSFKREYRAIFTDSNDSFFNTRKMIECTHKIGEYPTTQIKGESGLKYILAIDPSYSSSKNSDYFAMAVYLLDEAEQKLTLVHTYGKSGGELKNHFEYLAYLMGYFNIVFICIDGSGTEFITGFNESTIAQEKNLNLSFITAKLDADEPNEYHKALYDAKRQYNKDKGVIVWPQNFQNTSAIRRANDNLQNKIASCQIWFASSCCSDDKSFKRAQNITLPYIFKNENDSPYNSIDDFILEQDEWIEETKAQVALIEVTTTSSGVLRYDLPAKLKNLKSEKKPRKDHYTTLLLANWVAKMYFDMNNYKEKQQIPVFSPLVIH